MIKHIYSGLDIIWFALVCLMLSPVGWAWGYMVKGSIPITIVHALFSIAVVGSLLLNDGRND